MYSLVMDTSNRYLVIAMYKDGHLLDAISEVGSKRQSENAIPYIQKLLDQQHLELFDFDELIVTCGPGSYTGERVALTIAKTLKTVHPYNVKMISSLAAYAGVNGKKISVIDARSQKVFVGVYENGQPLEAEQMIAIADFEVLLSRYPDFEVVGESDVVGHEVKEVCLYQNIYDLSQMVQPVESVEKLVPRYIKDVEAKKIWHP